MFNKIIKISSTLLIFITYHCSAESIRATDIVGRDLDLPGLGRAGHIGIATADYAWQEAHYVVEALWEQPVLQINTLDNFKRRGPYWGAKYGINRNDISGTRIINEGAFQASLQCAEYTTTVQWKAGSGQWGVPYTCPKFRCDTFVNYLYWWGGYTLPTYSPPESQYPENTLPRMVFNLFPNFRNPTALSTFNVVIPKAPKTTYTNTINEITEKQLYNMPFLEFTHAVDLPSGLLTKNGIDNILKFADDSNLSDEKRLFLLDKLGFVSSPDMLSKLIELYYKNQDNPELAHMILRDTQDIYQEEKLLVNYPEEKQLLKEFYSALLDKNVSTRIDPIIIRGFISLNTDEEILINKTKLDQTLDDNKSLQVDTSLALKISLAFKSPELERLYIPRIISSLQKENILALDTLFTGAIVGRLGNLGLDALQIESKTQINHYLSAIKFKFDTKITNKRKIRNSMINNDIAIPQGDGMWLEAKALVNATSYKDASTYITKYLRSTQKSDYKKYIIGLSNSSYMKQAFDSEPILIDFKKANHEFYENTIGMPAR